MHILAIDPGNIESAYCLIDSQTYRPVEFGKLDNAEVLKRVSDAVYHGIDEIVIEMIAHYGSGMPAGKSVFDTCVWIGRFMQKSLDMGKVTPNHVFRSEVKMTICGTMRAKDGNIIQALADRFAPEVPNKGKGTKEAPGWFYGFKADVWQAYAVGVTYLDKGVNNVRCKMD